MSSPQKNDSGCNWDEFLSTSVLALSVGNEEPNKSSPIRMSPWTNFTAVPPLPLVEKEIEIWDGKQKDSVMQEDGNKGHGDNNNFIKHEQSPKVDASYRSPILHGSPILTEWSNGPWSSDAVRSEENNQFLHELSTNQDALGKTRGWDRKAEHREKENQNENDDALTAYASKSKSFSLSAAFHEHQLNTSQTGSLEENPALDVQKDEWRSSTSLSPKYNSSQYLNERLTLDIPESVFSDNIPRSHLSMPSPINIEVAALASRVPMGSLASSSYNVQGPIEYHNDSMASPYRVLPAATYEMGYCSNYQNERPHHAGRHRPRAASSLDSHGHGAMGSTDTTTFYHGNYTPFIPRTRSNSEVLQPVNSFNTSRHIALHQDSVQSSFITASSPQYAESLPRGIFETDGKDASFCATEGLPSSINGEEWFYEVEFKRFRRDFFIGKPDYFVGDYVKVEADRGQDLGHIIRVASDLSQLHSRTLSEISIDKRLNGTMMKLLRLATENELSQLVIKFDEEREVLEICRTKVLERMLPMQVLDAEYQFDRHKLTFFFEANRRIDFRELVRDLFAMYKTRIWLQQVTPDSRRKVDLSS